MTQNFDAPENNRQSAQEQSQKADQERDRFELLSAYLDGEVTATEREQVQQLLAEDTQVQQLYSRLINLRLALQSTPVPKEAISAQQLSNLVFEKIDRSQRRSKAWLWGGGAIAAVFVGGVASLSLGDRSPMFQLAQYIKKLNSEPLMIALNRPAVEMPPPADPFPHIPPRPINKHKTTF